MNELRLRFVIGEGIENDRKDAPVDIGIVAFLDDTWSGTFTSSVGYSQTDIDNTVKVQFSFKYNFSWTSGG